MKLFKHLAAVMALVLLPLAALAQSFPVEFEIPAGSGFRGEYDAASGVWRLTVEKSTNDIVPVIQTKPITAPVPADLTALYFEYRSTHELTGFDMQMFKVFLGSATRRETLNKPIHATQEWTGWELNMANYRNAPGVRFLNKAGQYQQWIFPLLPVGAVIELRAVRFAPNERPYKPVTLSGKGPVLIEAEDFNTSADGLEGRSIRNNQVPEINTRYIHPTGERFPIHAWGYLDYDGRRGEDAPHFMRRQLNEMWDCGFTIYGGSPYWGVNEAFLFDGKEINGIYVNLHDGNDLKIIVPGGLGDANEIAETVNRQKVSPRLAGWFIKDEPHRKDFPFMTWKTNEIRKHDTEHLCYGNLLHTMASMQAIDFNTYDEYVHTYVREVGLGMLSYDYYPVRQVVSTGDVSFRDDFFENLEIVSKLAKYYHTRFWAFAQSCTTNTAVDTEICPPPTEEYMRVELFSALAYGAQGVQYYTYTHVGYLGDESPINKAGEKTEIWYMVQRINRDIHALTPVFLGADCLGVWFTNPVTPRGCVRLTDDALPAGIAKVTSDGPGVLVSQLQNAEKLYMMVVNSDIFATQKVTVNVTSAMKRVLMNGTTEDVTPGVKEFTLAPGDALIWLVDENHPVWERKAPVRYASADYRADAPDVFINSDSVGGYYLAAMGDPNWDTYSAEIPASGSRVITRDQAVDNWGGKTYYTINVPEDMTVDIAVKHAVPWAQYGRVAATGVTPGYQYQIEGEPSLNWPKEYAASMILYIDGVAVKPANQPMRPAAPAQFSEDGAEFDAILADPSRWISTKKADGSVSEVLYFWPRSGADAGLTPDYRDEPDYRSIRLSAGTHRIEVRSLCYPWNFDNLRVTPSNPSALPSVEADVTDTRIFNLMGIECQQPLRPGIYIQAGRKFVVK